MKDLYGFKNTRAEKPLQKEDDLPIQPFSSERLMNFLSKTPIGEYVVNRPFSDQAQWGDNDGAIRARLTPNQGVAIERLITDMQGKPFWITKKMVKMKTNEYAGKEEVVANEIGDLLQDISSEQVDSANDYTKLETLTQRIAQKVKDSVPLFIYQEIKKINNNNYNILMTVLGGVGKIAHRIRGPAYTPAGIIDMSYDPMRGSIKGILTTIDIENEGGSWTIDVPYFMGEFAPSQPIDEIVDTLIAGLKFI